MPPPDPPEFAKFSSIGACHIQGHRPRQSRREPINQRSAKHLLGCHCSAFRSPKTLLPLPYGAGEQYLDLFHPTGKGSRTSKPCVKASASVQSPGGSSSRSSSPSFGDSPVAPGTRQAELKSYLKQTGPLGPPGHKQASKSWYTRSTLTELLAAGTCTTGMAGMLLPRTLTWRGSAGASDE